MKFTSVMILAQLLVPGNTFSMRIKEDESAWDPTTTSGRSIHGPAIVHYTRHDDGGIDVKVVYPEPEGEQAACTESESTS